MRKKFLVSILVVVLGAAFISCGEKESGKKEVKNNEKNIVETSKNTESIDEKIIEKFTEYTELLNEHMLGFVEYLADGEVTDEECKKLEKSIGKIDEILDEIAKDNNEINDEIFKKDTKQFIDSMKTSNKLFLDAVNGEDKLEESEQYMREAGEFLNKAVNRRNELKK